MFVKSIRPETMKIKLQIIENLGPEQTPSPLPYQITDGPLLRWRYGSEERPLASWEAETPPDGSVLSQEPPSSPLILFQ